MCPASSAPNCPVNIASPRSLAAATAWFAPYL